MNHPFLPSEIVWPYIIQADYGIRTSRYALTIVVQLASSGLVSDVDTTCNIGKSVIINNVDQSFLCAAVGLLCNEQKE